MNTLPTVRQALATLQPLIDTLHFYNIGKPAEPVSDENIPGAVVVDRKRLRALRRLIEFVEAIVPHVETLRDIRRGHCITIQHLGPSRSPVEAKRRGETKTKLYYALAHIDDVVDAHCGEQYIPDTVQPRRQQCLREKRNRAGTYDALETLCASKGIVLERRGKRIFLTTPDGGTTAEEVTVSDAFDTYRNDPAFRDLPIRMRKHDCVE